MDVERFSKALANSGMESAGIDHWLANIANPQRPKIDYETSEFISHPFNWYNPKLTSFIKPLGLPVETRSYIFMCAIAKILPEPLQISNWNEMIDQIMERTQEIGFITRDGGRLPINPDFLVKFSLKNSCSLEEWNLQMIYGQFWGILTAAIRLLRQAGPFFDAWCEPYMDMLARLLTPNPKPEFTLPGEDGLLMLSSHSRFHAEHTKQTKIKFRNRAFVVTGKMVKDKETTSVLPMLMLKALRAGNIVYSTSDGGKGNLSLEGLVFGCKVVFPSSFVWVSAKSNCECQWSYLVANRETTGTSLITHNFEFQNRKKMSYEAFTAEFLHKLTHQIENAMLEHPFSFGSYQNIWRELINNRAA